MYSLKHHVYPKKILQKFDVFLGRIQKLSPYISFKG